MKKRTKKAKVVRRDIYQTQNAACKIEREIGDLKRRIADLLPKLEQALKVHQEALLAAKGSECEDAATAERVLPHYSDEAIALAMRNAAGGVGHLLEVVELELPAEEVA